MTDDDRAGPDDGLSECDPTARGIVQCLRMLADEAQAIGLPHTLDALRKALEVCAAESTVTLLAESGLVEGPPPGTLIH